MDGIYQLDDSYHREVDVVIARQWGYVQCKSSAQELS